MNWYHASHNDSLLFEAMFHTELLQTFAAVVDEGSFTAAGARLGLTQSAVTAQIKRLEAQAGCALLIRNTRSLSLTPQGQVLLQGAREILSLQNGLREQLGVRRPLRGSLRIGLSDGFLSGSLAALLKRFQCDHPTLQLELHVGVTDILREQLRQGRLDLVLGVHCGGDGLGEDLWREPLVWAASDVGLFVSGGPLPMVFGPEPCPYRVAATAALAARRLDWRLACTSSGAAGCLAAARLGLGITPLLRSQLEPGLRDLSGLADLPELPAAAFAIWAPSDGASKSAALLADAVRAQAREFHGTGAWRVLVSSTPAPAGPPVLAPRRRKQASALACRTIRGR